MRTNRTEYLFLVNTRTPPTMTVDSDEDFTVEVRGAFGDVETSSRYRHRSRQACDGHPPDADSRADRRALRQVRRWRRDRLLSPERVRRHRPKR